MIILPIGHDDAEVRRQPWVTYALMAACVISLLATSGGVNEAESRAAAAQGRIVAALHHWSEHRYLRLDPELLKKVSPELAPHLDEATQDDALPPEGMRMREVAAEQADFDGELSGALAELSAAEASHPYRVHGLVPGAISAWGLFAHMFMHAGWMHLLGNLFMLFMAGPALEDRFGRPLFAAIYGVSGVGGALLFAALAKDPNMPLVGASGAIAGVFGAFLVRFWSTRIRFWYFLWLGLSFRQGTFERPAYLMLPLWLANEVLQAWLAHSFGMASGVANTAHIGGFFVGAAAAYALKASKLDEQLDRALEEKTTVQGNLGVAAALALREQGDLAGAIGQLALQVRKTPRDGEAVDAYWDACVAAGCAGDAAHAVLALAQRELTARDGARAAQRYLEVRAALPSYGFDAAFVARLVPNLREMDRGLAVEALRFLAQPRSGALAPTLAQRALDQARELDPLVAKQLARKLAAAADLPPEMRERFGKFAKALEAEAPDPAPGESDSGGIELASESAGAAPFRAEAPPGPTPDSTPDWDHTALPFEEGDTPALSSASEISPELTEPEVAEVSEESALGAAGQIASPDDDWDALKLLDTEETPLPAPAPRFASLKITEATPLALGEAALTVSLDGGRKAQLALAKIDAVSLAALRGLGPKPVLVVDLLIGWRSLEGGQLRCVRMRSDRFDPRKLAPAPDPLAALRTFVARLIEATNATPLGAADPARSDALTPFADAATYEREVLEVGA